jgi:hypothetical protein
LVLGLQSARIAGADPMLEEPALVEPKHLGLRHPVRKEADEFWFRRGAVVEAVIVGEQPIPEFSWYSHV